MQDMDDTETSNGCLSAKLGYRWSGMVHGVLVLDLHVPQLFAEQEHPVQVPHAAEPWLARPS